MSRQGRILQRLDNKKTRNWRRGLTQAVSALYSGLPRKEYSNVPSLLPMVISHAHGCDSRDVLSTGLNMVAHGENVHDIHLGGGRWLTGGVFPLLLDSGRKSPVERSLQDANH